MKKFLAIILSVLLLMTSVPLVIFAETETPALPDSPCFVVSQSTGKVGETVEVTVSAINNPGIVSTKIKVYYDTEVLKLVSYKAGDFSASGYSWGRVTNYPFIINWCDAISPDNYSELLATLTFEVLDGAAYGASPVTITFSCEDDVYNYNWETVEFVPVNGEVYVLYPVTGVELDRESVNLYKDDTTTLSASVLSEGKADETIIWSVADTSIATVDENGVVTAVGLGSTVVTATTVDGGFTASCTVDVACAHRNEVAVDAVPSTCIQPGHAAYTVCGDCGEIIAGSDADLPLADHIYDGVVTTAPTCGAEGEMTYTCTVCGDSYTEAVPATGEHTYDHDCDATCNGCDFLREVAPHPYVGEITTAPTCGKEGVKTYTCAVCGDSYTETVLATGEHTYDHDCDATCNGCNFVREVEPHPYVGVITTEPTCGAEGVKTYTCAVCGDSYTTVVPATGKHAHQGVITTEPTCGTSGVKTYTCVVCSDSYTESVPATGEHVYDYACDAECNVCGHIREAQPHKYSHQYDPECNVCGRIRQVPPIPDDVSAFVVDDVEARVGEEFTVAIRIENNVGIVSFKFKVHYDTDLFELVKYEAGAFTPQTYGAIDHAPFIVNWCDAIHPDNTTNDVAVLLTFRVKDGVEAQQSTISLTYDFEDVYNANWEGIYFKTVDGIVNVTSAKPGDVNNDGRVNNRDLGLLQQYLNEWGVSIYADAADVNDDKRVNNRDLGLLQQYLNEWDVVLK